MFYYSIASVTSFGALDNGCLTISVGMLWLLLIFGIYGIYCICSPSLFAYIQQERCVIIKIGEWDLAVIHLLLLQRSSRPPTPLPPPPSSTGYSQKSTGLTDLDQREGKQMELDPGSLIVTIRRLLQVLLI